MKCPKCKEQELSVSKTKEEVKDWKGKVLAEIWHCVSSCSKCGEIEKWGEQPEGRRI